MIWRKNIFEIFFVIARLSPPPPPGICFGRCLASHVFLFWLKVRLLAYWWGFRCFPLHSPGGSALSFVFLSGKHKPCVLHPTIAWFLYLFAFVLFLSCFLVTRVCSLWKYLLALQAVVHDARQRNAPLSTTAGMLLAAHVDFMMLCCCNLFALSGRVGRGSTGKGEG